MSTSILFIGRHFIFFKTMINIIHEIKKDTYIMGDVHGEFKALGTWFKNHNLKDCNVIICGDFGLGFDGLQKEQQDLLRAERYCENNNIDCYVIRGNHDDPSYYNTNEQKISLKHIHPVSDYTIISTPCNNILCLGGAVSTDRSHRIDAYDNEVTEYSKRRHCSIEQAKNKVKRYWWPEEKFVFDETIIKDIINSDIKIDTICSHAAPHFCYPTTSSRVQYWINVDPTLEEDLNNERNELSQIFDLLGNNEEPLKNWFYGHYHAHASEVIAGTRFTLLDMGRNGRMSGGVGGLFDMIQIKNE